MTVFWMSIRKAGNGKFESENLRQKEMKYDAALKELLYAVEKLKYVRCDVQKCTIIVMKSDNKKNENVLTMSVIGNQQEIAKMLCDPGVARHFSR